jgi:peptide/nickel transport system substrate-binding protein
MAALRLAMARRPEQTSGGGSQMAEPALPLGPDMTRRELLVRTLPKVLTLPMGAALLAACGQVTSKASNANAPAASSTAAATTTAASGPVTGGDAVWSTYGTLSFINPILVSDTSTGLLVGFIYDPLVNFDTKYNPVPALASSWETSSDNKSWTFHLRSDATWHDGTPFTSKDVAFTVQAILHPTYTGQRVSNYTQLIGVPEYLKQLSDLQAKQKAKTLSDTEFNTQSLAAWQSWIKQNAVETPDDHTVIFHLSSVFAPFLSNVGGSSPIPEHLFKDTLGAAMPQSKYNTQPIGTGPFKYLSGDTKDHMTVARYDGYYGTKAYLSQIITRIIPQVTSAEAALQSKQIDYSQIQPPDAARFKGLDYIDVLTSPTFSYEYMGYNLQHPLFQDQNLRIAICYAVPKDQMVKTLLLGYGETVWTHGSPARWDYNPNVTKYQYDPAKAKSMLAADGWKPNSSGILEKNGTPLKFTISTSQGNGTPQKATVIIQESLKQIGMDVSVQQFDWSTFVNKVLLAKNFDTAVVGWSLGPDPDSYTIWHSGQSFNFVSYNNPTVDKLEEEGRTTLQQSARAKIYGQIEEILATEQPYLFLYSSDAIDGLNKRLEGPITDSPRGLTYNINDWFIPKAMQGGPSLVSG